MKPSIPKTVSKAHINNSCNIDNIFSNINYIY